MPPAPHPANEAERLAALRSYAILDTDREDGFDILAGLAARLIGCRIALVSLVDAQRQWCKARHGWDASETPRELAFCSHAVLDPCHPLAVADATLDVRFADNALVTGRAGVRFYVGMPLVDPAGYALGTLCVIDRVPRAIAPQALETLAGLAQAVMATLELRRALGQARAMALAVLIETTARRTAVQETEHRELERSNADLDEFAYTAAHDLKAPLRAIAHLAQWIGEDIGATASAETLGNLNLLQGRATRLQVLLDELLAYSRVGRVGSPVEDVDLGEVVREVADLLVPPPGFVVACEGEMPVLRTHRTPLRLVLENLIGNALKHHDRAAGRVTVAMQMTHGVAEFRVSDDGPGIAPRFHNRIFAIFQTLASGDTVGSSGIGLAIVKKMVLRHGGEIRAESAPPVRGTTFIFTWREAEA
jgi:signal transduction histidine kinase